MEDLAVFTALNHSGSFGKNFVRFLKKIKMSFTSLGRSVLGKIVPIRSSRWRITYVTYSKILILAFRIHIA